MKERKSILPKQSGIYWLIFFVFCLAVAGFFYFQIKEPEEVWFEGEGKNLKGISIEPVGSGEKIIKNDIDGYEFTLDESVELGKKSNTLLFYEDSDKTLPDYTLTSYPNEENLSLGDWLIQYNEKNWLMFFGDKEKINLDNRTFYKVQEEGDPTTYSYFFALGNKIFIITTQEGNDYGSILSIFSSLKLN